MDGGFSIFNENTIMQIDSSYKNLFLIAQFNYSDGTTVNNIPNNPMQQLSMGAIKKFTLSKNMYSSRVAVAMSLHNGYACAFGGAFYTSSGVDVYVYITSYYNTTPPTPSNAKVFIFGDLPVASLGNFGLEVYDDSTNLVFSSNQKPLKVIDSLKYYAGYRYYSPSFSTLNKALLFQGLNASLVIGEVSYQEGDDSELTDSYSCDTFYVYNKAILVGGQIANVPYDWLAANTVQGNAPTSEIDDPKYWQMDYLYAMNLRDGGARPPAANYYYMAANLPLLIDTTNY